MFFIGTLSVLARAANVKPALQSVDGGDWPPDAGPPLESDPVDDVTGTYLYLEVACPGPNSYDFGRDFE